VTTNSGAVLSKSASPYLCQLFPGILVYEKSGDCPKFCESIATLWCTNVSGF